MPITLAEAKATMVDKVDQAVVDEFRRESFLLDKLTFDDAAAPVTGGSTLTYSYTRLKTPSTASTRTVNTEYAADEAIKENSRNGYRFGDNQAEHTLRSTEDVKSLL